MRVIFRTVFGSHLYGLQTPSSDYDYKSVFVPSLSGLLLQGPNLHYSYSTGNDSSKNTKDDIDDESFSIATFVDLACKGETVAIDMLHARGPDNILVSSDLWRDFIYVHRKKFYTKNMRAYLGYVKKQAAKYSIKGSRVRAFEDVIDVLGKVDPESRLEDVLELIEPTEFVQKKDIEIANGQYGTGLDVCSKKFNSRVRVKYILESLRKTYGEYGHRAKLARENKGIDWKALSHAFRAGYQLRAIYKHGDFVYPLEETEFLMDVKLGNLDYLSSVQPKLESLVEEVGYLAEQSTLPLQVDRSFWDKQLIKLYSEVFDLNFVWAI